MQLHDVHQGIHRRKKRKRVGRGIGSGHGKTSSKGHKGHASRQGFKLSPLFEGGQMPLARRVPKRGFFNGAFKKDFAIVNLDDLDACFEAGAVIDEAALRARAGQGPRTTTASRSWATASSPRPSKSMRPSSAARPPPRSPPPAARPVVVCTKPRRLIARPRRDRRLRMLYRSMTVGHSTPKRSRSAGSVLFLVRRRTVSRPRS